MDGHDSTLLKWAAEHEAMCEEYDRWVRDEALCADCRSWMIPPRGNEYGWCLLIEDYVHEAGHPGEWGCEEYTQRL